MNTVVEDWERYKMWGKLIPGYSCLSKSEKKRAKRDFATENGLTCPGYVNLKGCIFENMIVKDFNKVVKASEKEPACIFLGSVKEHVFETKTKKKKETDMFLEDYTYTYSDLHAQRSYLSSRLNEVEDILTTAAKKKYGILVEDPPRSLKEFVERIKADQFTYNKDNFAQSVWNPHAFIVWRDPAVEVDFDGFNAANAKMKEDLKKVTDIITLKTLDEGLKAIQDFEATVY